MLKSTRYIALPLAAVAGFCSCREKAGDAPSPETKENPSWISQAPDTWPQLVLTNRASFEGHSSLGGASGFLAENSRGETFYATAAHLLGPNGGVDPEIRESELDLVLKSWVAYPRTMEDSTVRITGVAGVPPANPNIDWALLKIDQSAGELPAQPLRFRRQPVSVGEKVYLLGVPYSEPDRVQNVYAGVVTARKFGDRFRFDIDPPVDIRGFSGAPIIDESGRVVGVMTVWFDPKMDGELFLEAGGEDASAIYDRLEAARP